MTREELVELRNSLQAQAERLRAIGDYGAGAADIRDVVEAVLKIAQHLADRMRRG